MFALMEDSSLILGPWPASRCVTVYAVAPTTSCAGTVRAIALNELWWVVRSTRGHPPMARRRHDRQRADPSARRPG